MKNKSKSFFTLSFWKNIRLNKLVQSSFTRFRNISLSLFFIFTYSHCVAQDVNVDSMKAVIASAKEDTVKINTLIKLAKRYFAINDGLLAVATADQAKALAEKSNFSRGLAHSIKWIGNGYYKQGKYIEAFEYWNRSMAVFDSIHDSLGVANILTNMAVVYNNQGLNEKAQDCNLKALKIAEQSGDKERMSSAYINIGDIYADKQNQFDKAIENYKRALPLSAELHDTDMIASAYIGIGEVYIKLKLHVPALFNLNKALEVVKGKEAEQYVLNLIGKAYTLRGDYNSAIKYHLQAIELSKKQESKLDMTKELVGLGIAYEGNKNFKSAIDAFKRAEEIGLEIKAQMELSYTYDGLAKSYSGVNDFTNAFKYQTMLTVIRDSIYNAEAEKKLESKQMAYELDKTQGQLDLKELDLKKQRVIKNITIGGLSIVMMFLVVVFFQKKRITKEKKRSDELLLNILPEETAEELKATGTAKAKSFDLVSVLFTDFKNFTQASEKLSPEELVHEINLCYSEFDRIITKFGIEKIKTIGDAYMCAGGLPASNLTHPVDVVRAGLEMQEFIAKNKKEREEKELPFFELRLGIHTGPVVAGIVGIKKFAYDIWGDTVNTASRMESSGEIGKVNVSGTTYEMIKDKFVCTHRGKVKAKNKGEIDMYFVERPI